MTRATSETFTRGNHGGGAPKIQLTAAQVETALRASAGLKTVAARKLGISRSTLYRFLWDHPEIEETVRDINEDMLDLAESNVVKALNAGDIATTRWYLETKGKERGYTRMVSVTGKNGKPLEVQATINVKTLTTETLRELALARIDDGSGAQ